MSTRETDEERLRFQLDETTEEIQLWRRLALELFEMADRYLIESRMKKNEITMLERYVIKYHNGELKGE